MNAAGCHAALSKPGEEDLQIQQTVVDRLSRRCSLQVGWVRAHDQDLIPRKRKRRLTLAKTLPFDYTYIALARGKSGAPTNAAERRTPGEMALSAGL